MSRRRRPGDPIAPDEFVRPDDGDARDHWDRMIAGDLYIADASDRIASANARATTLMERYNSTTAARGESRRALLRDLLGTCGDDVVVRAPLYIDYGVNLHIGDGTFVNYGLTALDVAPIRIGRHCQIATSVQLLTATHPVDPALRRAGWESGEPITLGDNVWLGGGVIVCPGVTIGDNTVVGAGAVVTRDLPANVVAVGNPARVLREL
ncbi:maltose O-acetyltransferase [Raineyella antarctica]|uniref:Maltose O-acetyltransferase n=1 Tax=Raineyella antarctica TaxID=1577474 RepID=A0A1G6H7X5_9ACTN|nr:sugar O-acetyltransferase [Raineyella antarctica]SDB90263.1 maltose O-acetyltransferase [Raineyella antarctica]